MTLKHPLGAPTRPPISLEEAIIGTLYYGSSRTPLDVDDATLRHLEIVAVAKLRRSEPFMLTVDGAIAGRVSVWIHASTDLHFSYEATEAFDPDREVVDRYMRDSATPAGLMLVADVVVDVDVDEAR